MKDLLRHRSFLGRNFYTKQHLHSQHIERELFPMSSHSFGRLGASLCCRLPLWCLEALLKIFLEEKLLISSLLRWIFWNNTTKIALRFLCYLKAQVLHDLAVSKFRHVTSKTQNTFYVTGCTTERVWGGGAGLLIITFSSWPRLLVLKMCIVRLYLKTCSNHQTVFIFTFVSTRLSDNSTGAFNRKLTCWGIKLVSPSALIWISSFTGIIQLRKYSSALFLFFPCIIPYFCPTRAKDTRFRSIPQNLLPPKHPGIENFKPHKILRSLPSPAISSSWKRAWIRSNKVFRFQEYWNNLLLHRTTEYILYQDSRGPFSKYT